jgi:hypothetical protein
MAIPRNLANLANQLNGDGDVPKIEVGDSSVVVTDTGSDGKITGTADNTEVFSVEKGKTFVLQGGVSSTGVGIAFPANQATVGASTNANTMDDYEEGTWTPTLVGAGGGSFTYSFQSGSYTRMGRVVVLDGRLQWTATTSSGDFVNIQGLPFSTTAGLPIGSFRNNSFTVTGSIVGYISIHMELSQISQTGTLSAIPVTSSGEIQFSVSYMG